MASSKITLTKEQNAVVNDRGGNLLVAAAAGSGKTKVLVERIMKRVCEEDENIDRFLVITYTRAAASELRAKITAELSKRLAEDGSNKHIQEQLYRIYATQISTVHSFCTSILRSHASEAGLSADFRVGEEQECKVLKSAAMEELLESIYKDIEKHPNVKAFVEELAFGRDDSAVPAILFNIYDTVQAHPWPQKWADACVDNMDISHYEDAGETPWGAYILEDTKKYILSQLPLVDMAIDICDGDTALSEAYSGALTADRAKLTQILKSETWNDMFLAIEGKWARLKPIKRGAEYSAAIQERIKGLRDRYKKSVDDKMKGIYALSDIVLEDLQNTEAPIRGMFELVKEFSKRYQAKKEQHNMLDFSDLEHRSIDLLIDSETLEPTEVAKAISKQFTEIMIDEYQDTNGVQEAIFEAVSNGRNRFMVGDVKQSIYMFRLADPSIFLEHYNEYKDYTEAEDGEPRKILLSQNFRSREEILEATNAVMETCMSPDVGGITYGEKEALSVGRTDFAPTEEPPVELIAINMDRMAAIDKVADEEVETVAKADIEAKYVASRIKEMLDSGTIMDEDTGAFRKITPNDIAILMQAPRRPAAHYVKALADLGIAAKSSKNGSIMDTTEVATIYAYLQILDNPLQDIPLVAVLASPIAGFTADDLANVRICKKDSRTFYEALRAYAEEEELGAKFLNQFDNLRKIVSHTKLSRLFSELLEVTDAMDVFGSMPNGDQRIANIQKFSEMIASFEAGGSKGLFEFLCYIESLREQGEELPQASCTNADEAVTIMSIHASKGLEFPVVFLADLSRKFNVNDLKGSALLHRDLGAGVQVVATTSMGTKHRYPTIARNAIAAKNRSESISEDLRVLYVAMTRAKQKLIMTYCDKLDKLMPRLGAEAQSPLPPTISQSVANPGHWVLYTALCRYEAVQLQRLAQRTPLSPIHSKCRWNIKVLNAEDIGGKTLTLEELERSAEDEGTEKEFVLEEEMFPPLDIEKLTQDLSFEYPHMAAITTPSLAAASKLYGKRAVTISRPNFAKKSGLTAAERGTATHLFMRYANYALCAAEGTKGIKAELTRLVEKGFMSKETADGVYIDVLGNFFKSEIGHELAMLSPGKTKREAPFTLLLPANEVYDDEDAPKDNIVVQGIIDLFTITEKGVIIYDFKTDGVENDKAAEEKAKEYAPQLNLYEKALSQIYGLPVIEKSVIFLRTSKKFII